MSIIKKDGTTITAILTKRGRDLLASGKSDFKITKFALSDDGVDYTLWNPLAGATINFGKDIENLPMFEPNPDETQNMKYKLVTLPKNSVRISTINVAISEINFTNSGQEVILTPNDSPSGINVDGYTVTLSNSLIADIYSGNSTTKGSATRNSITSSGKTFRIVAKGSFSSALSGTITITGNNSGAKTAIPITIEKLTSSSTVSTPESF